MNAVKGGSLLLERTFLEESSGRYMYIDYYDGRAERWSTSSFKYADTMVIKKLRLKEPNSVFLKKLDLLIMADATTVSCLPGRSSFRYEHVVCDRGTMGQDSHGNVIQSFRPKSVVLPFISIEIDNASDDSDDDFTAMTKVELDKHFDNLRIGRGRGRGNSLGRGGRKNASVRAKSHTPSVKDELARVMAEDQEASDVDYTPSESSLSEAASSHPQEKEIIDERDCSNAALSQDGIKTPEEKKNNKP